MRSCGGGTAPRWTPRLPLKLHVYLSRNWQKLGGELRRWYISYVANIMYCNTRFRPRFKGERTLWEGWVTRWVSIEKQNTKIVVISGNRRWWGGELRSFSLQIFKRPFKILTRSNVIVFLSYEAHPNFSDLALPKISNGFLPMTGAYFFLQIVSHRDTSNFCYWINLFWYYNSIVVVSGRLR